MLPTLITTTASYSIDGPLTIGRSPSNDIVVANPLVSEHHLRIRPVGTSIEISDLGSTNGTYLNGQRITGTTIARPGDQIRIGTEEMIVSGVQQQPPDPAFPLTLVVESGADRGAEVALRPGQTILIGRDSSSGLVLQDPLVSGAHCQISVAPVATGQFCSGCGAPVASPDAFCPACGHLRSVLEVKDLGSANGVLVDRKRIEPGRRETLAQGSLIQLGDTVIRVGREAVSATGTAPTIFRTTAGAVPPPPPPLTGTAAQPPAGSPVPIAQRFELPKVDRTIVAGISAVVGGTLLVLVITLALVGRLPGQGENDAAWVRTEFGPATVQVAAFVNGSEDYLSVGSGSVIDKQRGLVITNFHVMSDEQDYPLPGLGTKIRLDNSDEWLDTEVIGYSACDDLALLRITSDLDEIELKEVRFANAADVRAGTTVIALGFPGTVESIIGTSEQMTVTQGIVSKLDVKAGSYRDLIQIDADINKGSSGGPLFDLEGKQVGVNTLALSSAGLEGVNYAISVDTVQKLLPQLRDGYAQAGLESCLP